jgi:hypothetical protein
MLFPSRRPYGDELFLTAVDRADRIQVDQSQSLESLENLIALSFAV